MIPKYSFLLGHTWEVVYTSYRNLVVFTEIKDNINTTCITTLQVRVFHGKGDWTPQ